MTTQKHLIGDFVTTNAVFLYIHMLLVFLAIPLIYCTVAMDMSTLKP